MLRAAIFGFASTLTLLALTTNVTGLSVNITNPQDGTWTAQSTVLVSGTASDASRDQLLLDSDSDFSGGSGFGYQVSVGVISHDISPLETYRYYQDFNSIPLPSRTIDEHWLWNLSGAEFSVVYSASYSNDPPALIKQGIDSAFITWNAVVPGSIGGGRFSFDYFCQNNGYMRAWVSPDGFQGSETKILDTGSTVQRRIDYELAAALNGSQAIFVRFELGASSAGAVCSVDRAEALVNFTRLSSAANYSFVDDFSGGLNAVWHYPGLSIFSSDPNASDTPPTIGVQASLFGGLSAQWGFATSIRGLTVAFHYQCQPNATLELQMGTAASNVGVVWAGTQGAGHTAVTLNESALVTGSRGTLLLFHATSPVSDWDDLCFVDDFAASWTVEGNQNLSYSGLFSSRIFDLGGIVNFTSAGWASTTPADTQVSVLFRVSNNNTSFSVYSPLNGSGVPPPPSTGRYVQFRIAFASTRGLNTSSLEWLILNFSAITAVTWSVNGSVWQNANGTSSWTATIPLSGGSNVVTVRATDTTGAFAEAMTTLGRDVFAPSAPGTPLSSPFSRLPSVSWNWSPANDVGLGVDHYLIDVGSSAGASDVLSNATVATNSFSASGLADGVVVFLRVRAADRAGLIGPPAISANGTLVDLTPPTAINFTVLPANFSNSTVLSWSWAIAKDSGSGVDHYVLQLGNASGASNYQTYTTTGAAFSFSAATHGSIYYLSVASVDAAGNVGPTRTAPRVVVDREAPPPPASLTVPPSFWNQRTLALSWTAVADPVSGLSHYSVLIGTDGGLGDIAEALSDTTAYSLGGAESGRTYYFAVRAVDRAGNLGQPLMAANATLVDLEAPAVPSLSAVPPFVVQRNFTLSWSAPLDLPLVGSSGIDHYQVRVIAGGGQRPVANQSNNGFEMSLVDGRTYRVFVAAVDRAGNIGQESVSEFTADLTGPSAPTGLRVAFAGTDEPLFSLTWNPANDNGSGVREFRVSVGTAPGGRDVVDGAATSDTRYAWRGSFGKAYYVSVWAIDNAGNVGLQASADGPTIAPSPQGGGALSLAVGLAGIGIAGAVAFLVISRSRKRR